MAEKNSKSRQKKKGKGKKKGMSLPFKLAVIFVVILPVGGLLVWYFTTAALTVSGSKLSASEMIAVNIAKVHTAMVDDLEVRAKKENFSMDQFDKCTEISSQYRLPEDVEETDALNRKLLGMRRTANHDDMMDRCVFVAKIVKRMEKLSHHYRHVVMCGEAIFTSDQSARFKILIDPRGRGLIESFGGKEKLIPIPKGSHTLIRQWQVYNIGDGCLIVGLSSSGIFKMSATVK